MRELSALRPLALMLAIVACDGAPMAADAACSPAACDDGLFCNGLETCGAAGACQAGDDPCPDIGCDDLGDVCRDTTPCDEDGDGVESLACGGPDCDDDDRDRFPGNRERCAGTIRDGLLAASHDEDCDPCTVVGVVPDGDADADLYPSDACSNPWLGVERPLGCDANRTRIEDADMVVRGIDCNDDPAAAGGDVHPFQAEDCGNMIDDNCDGLVDEGVFYLDEDNDGRGDPSTRTTMCGTGRVSNADDCDDSRPETYLDAPEICDALDNDCSLPGAMAGGPDPTEDVDGDEHATEDAACLGAGEPLAPDDAFPRDDCDDTAASGATRHPGALERCNGIDEDCDGVADTADEDTSEPGVGTVGGACGTDVGLCVAGVLVCDDTAIACGGAGFVDRVAETCTHQDHDCDGAFDEGARAAGCPTTSLWDRSMGASLPAPICVLAAAGSASASNCSSIRVDSPIVMPATAPTYQLAEVGTSGARGLFVGGSAVDASANTVVDASMDMANCPLSGFPPSCAFTSGSVSLVLSRTRAVAIGADGLAPDATGYALRANIVMASVTAELYRLSAGGPISMGVSTMSCPLSSSVERYSFRLEIDNGSVTGEISGGGCTSAASAVHTDWAVSTWGEGPTYPRYYAGAIAVSPPVTGSFEATVESLGLTRIPDPGASPSSIRGSCLCP